MKKAFKFKTLKKAVELYVVTRSPTKWLLVDRETGQIFQGNENGYWDRLDPVLSKDNDRNK
jgi:hypothetical protein